MFGGQIGAGLPLAAASPTTAPIAWLADRPVVALGLLLGLAGDLFAWFWWRRVYTKGYKEQYDSVGDGWRDTGDFIDPPREEYATFLAWALQPRWKTGGEDPDLDFEHRKERVVMPVGFVVLGLLYAVVSGFGLAYTVPTVGGILNDLLSLVGWAGIGLCGAHIASIALALPVRILQRIVGAGRTVASTVGGDDGGDSAFAADRQEAEQGLEPVEADTAPDADSPDDGGTSTGAPLDPADYTVAELRDALESVDSEAALRGILAAEREGKDRKTGKEAIRRRLRQIDADPDATPTPDEDDGTARDTDATTAGDAATGAGTSAGEPSPGDDPVPTDADIAFEDIERGERIGSGGNAEVYRATWDADGGREIALKTPNLPSEETVDASFFERFEEEAGTWARLDDHPHVVGVLDWGLDPHPWLALELLEGGNLAARMPLPPAAATDLVLDVADAVRHAHDRGVVHNDLKPANVLFTDAGVPKVGDWGLAKVLLDHSMTSSDGLSPAYAAPEQFDDGERDAAALRRVDVYQLGALAYAALTGGPPFEGSTFEVLDAVKNDRPVPPSEVADGVPEAVDEVVLTAMAKDPGDRYPTVVHLVEALETATERMEASG